MKRKFSTSLPEFKKLCEYKSKNPLTFLYIPVLDENPVNACNYLTRVDLIDSYKLLKETFEEIGKGKSVRGVLANTILYSKENFEWYCLFAKEATRLLKEEKIEIPYECIPDVSIGRVKVYQPFGVYYNEKKKIYYAEELKFNREDNDPVNNYRIKYIIEQHELNEFIGSSYPIWYSLTDLTIYEKYCAKTNTRIRIDFKDEKLHYFIAGASDNWKEIEDVPSNMIYVIFALLFRTMDVNAIEEDI